MTGLAVVALGLAGCAAEPTSCGVAYPASFVQRPFLWEVSGSQGSIVLYGTYQAAGPADVSPKAWEALERAELFVAEADEVPDGARYGSRDDWSEAFNLPRGTSLEKLLAADDFYELRRRLEMETRDLARLKPWVAFYALGARAVRPPDPNISAALLDRVRKRGLSTEFFETWQQQVAFLDASVTPDKLARAIHDYPKVPCIVARGVAAFRAGDDTMFINNVAGADDPIVTRIGRWAATVEGYLASGRRAFVAVGVSHLVGPYGLVAQLASRGYQVRRL